MGRNSPFTKFDFFPEVFFLGGGPPVLRWNAHRTEDGGGLGWKGKRGLQGAHSLGRGEWRRNTTADHTLPRLAHRPRGVLRRGYAHGAIASEGAVNQCISLVPRGEGV